MKTQHGPIDREDMTENWHASGRPCDSGRISMRPELTQSIRQPDLLENSDMAGRTLIHTRKNDNLAPDGNHCADGSRARLSILVGTFFNDLWNSIRAIYAFATFKASCPFLFVVTATTCFPKSFPI